MDAVVFRGAERLLIVIIGGLALYWGFRLFDRALQESGQLVAKTGKFSLGLKNVGPGVFFALFGTALLAISITTQVRTTSDGQTLYQQRAAGQVDDPKAGAATGLATVNRTLDLLQAGSEDSAQRTAANELADKLHEHRRWLVDTMFGNGAMARFDAIVERIRRNPDEENRLSPDERDVYNAVRRALEMR